MEEQKQVQEQVKFSKHEEQKREMQEEKRLAREALPPKQQKVDPLAILHWDTANSLLSATVSVLSADSLVSGAHFLLDTLAQRTNHLSSLTLSSSGSGCRML